MLLSGIAGYRFVGNVIENGSDCPTAMGLDGRGDVAYNVIRDYSGLLVGAIYTRVNGAFNPHVRIHHNWFAGSISDGGDVPCVLQTMDYRPSLDSNLIQGNTGPTVGPFQGYSGIIDARDNRWGDPSGPYHPTLNPEGQGDTLLSDSVLFIPWLTEPPDTSMPPGYLTVGEPHEVPSTWQLMQVYPDPFNSTLRIVQAGFTGNDFELTLHNLLGQVVDVVHRGPLTGGELSYTATPTLASGVYFLKASDRRQVASKKVILLK